MKAAIDIYRENFPYTRRPAAIRLRDDGAHGLFVLGQFDRYISHGCCIILANSYTKLRIEVLPGANHFAQQTAPVQVNSLMREFLGDSSRYSCELVDPMVDEL